MCILHSSIHQAVPKHSIVRHRTISPGVPTFSLKCKASAPTSALLTRCSSSSRRGVWHARCRPREVSQHSSLVTPITHYTNSTLLYTLTHYTHQTHNTYCTVTLIYTHDTIHTLHYTPHYTYDTTNVDMSSTASALPVYCHLLVELSRVQPLASPIARAASCVTHRPCSLLRHPSLVQPLASPIARAASLLAERSFSHLQHRL